MCVCWILLANVVNALTPTNNTMLLWFSLERNLCFELFRWVSILRMVSNFSLFLRYVYLVHRSCCNFICYISHKEVLPCREIEKTSWSSEKGVHVIKTNKARCNVCSMLHKRFIYVLVFFFTLCIFIFILSLFVCLYCLYRIRLRSFRSAFFNGILTRFHQQLHGIACHMNIMQCNKIVSSYTL